MGRGCHRDPNVPKRGQSAFFLYSNAMRETLRAEHPGMSFGQVAKRLSQVHLIVS